MTSGLRISSDCPKCTRPLVRRTRRRDGNPFLSCSGYPRCDFAEDYDSKLNDLVGEVDELRREVSALRHQVVRGGPRAEVDRELRGVITFAHPDRWPDAQDLAHGVTSRLNALREKL